MLLAMAMLPFGQAGDPPYAVPRLEGVTIKGLPAVTGRIAVDQFGCLPDSTKVAVVSDRQKGYDGVDRYAPGSRLEMRSRRDGKTVLSGAPAPWHGCGRARPTCCTPSTASIP